MYDDTLKDVNIGDILISRVGDIIPLDGVVLSGEASINEATITGEAMAIDKFIDSKIKTTYIVIDPLFKDCNFERDGWSEKFRK